MSRNRRAYRGAMAGMPSSKPFDRVDWIGSRLRRTKITLNKIERIIEDTPLDVSTRPALVEALRQIKAEVQETLKQEQIDANR